MQPVRPSLRLAIELAGRDRGVTSSELAAQCGQDLAWAATRLHRCVERGHLRIVGGSGLRRDPYRYAVTDRGRRLLAGQADESPRWSFAELMRALGPAVF